MASEITDKIYINAVKNPNVGSILMKQNGKKTKNGKKLNIEKMDLVFKKLMIVLRLMLRCR